MASAAHAPPPPARCLEWRSTKPPTRFLEVIGGVVTMTAVYAAMAFAMLLLALLVVTPVVLFRGESWMEIAAGWLAPGLWWGLLGIAFAMALAPTPFIFLFREVEAFCMDGQTRMLETVERRAWFAPVTRSWSFAAITSIVPTITSSSSGLAVTLIDARGTTRQLQLGQNLSRGEIEAQSLWLRGHFGDRVGPIDESFSD